MLHNRLNSVHKTGIHKRKQLKIEQDKCNVLRPRTTGSFLACMNEVLSAG